MTLTDRQKLWVEEYLTCWSQTEAARRVGYAQPRDSGHDNWVHPEVQELLRKRLAEKGMEADEVLARLSEHARADMGDFLTKSGRGWRVDLKKAEAAGKLFLVKKYTKTKSGVMIELHDVQGALEKLARAHGLFIDQTKQTTVNEQVEVHFYMPENGREQSDHRD